MTEIRLKRILYFCLEACKGLVATFPSDAETDTGSELSGSSAACIRAESLWRT